MSWFYVGFEERREFSIFPETFLAESFYLTAIIFYAQFKKNKTKNPHWLL